MSDFFEFSVFLPLVFMKKKIHLKEKIRQFHEWQQKPHVVAPLSEQEHECATCGTHYTGNFCPRCGQSQRIRRYSFKTAVLNFLDVWGLGNRGMFRTIRDLILRPGYMIRDYLSGMQMAYFPPFKMFFLLFALSFLVSHGLNIKGENFSKEVEVKKQELAERAPVPPRRRRFPKIRTGRRPLKVQKTVRWPHLKTRWPPKFAPSLILLGILSTGFPISFPF